MHAPSGDHAKEMEACSEEEVERGIAALLAAYPAINTPKAKPQVVRSSWGSDPLFRGSYSYVNAKGTPEDIDTLAAPLMVRILHSLGSTCAKQLISCSQGVAFWALCLVIRGWKSHTFA